MSELDVFESRFAEAYRRYLDEAPTAVDAAAVVRSVAAAHPRTRMRLAWPWASRPIPALAWLLLIAALLAALGGAAIVGSRLLEAVPVRLVPTGIDVLTPDAGAYGRVVVDGNGIVWGLEPDGRLVRLDPATGSGQTWSVSDDAAFAASDIAPAKAGGVWLINGHTLRWFDGSAFRQVIEAPEVLGLVAEAPDATLWAAARGAQVLHWNGSSWTTLDPLGSRSDTWINAIAVDAAGHPWIGWMELMGTPGVSRYDGSTWTTFGETVATTLGDMVSGIAQAPGGAVLVATRRGLVRFDGTSWTDQTPEPSAQTSSTVALAAGIDGAIWVAEGAQETGQDSGPFTVREFDGRSWMTYGPVYGLQVPAEGRVSLVPTKQGLYVGTRAGIYRLSNGSWERAWPPASSPTNLTILVAVSHDELWASGNGGLWHFQAGAWTNEPIDPSRPTDAPVAMALAPDGTVWAAGQAGVAYRRNDRWTIADRDVAAGIAVDAGGTVWVAGNAYGGIPVWTLRFDGTAFVKGSIELCPVYLGSGVSLAVDATGALWVGAHSTIADGRVARFDGRGWKRIDQLGGPSTDSATVIGPGADGAVWVVTESPSIRAARFDGTAWTFVEAPDDAVGSIFFMGSDGTLWIATFRGPARYDGQGWTFPFASVFPPTMASAGSYGIAPDGTVFGETGTGIVRFPARAPQP